MRMFTVAMDPMYVFKPSVLSVVPHSYKSYMRLPQHSCQWISFNLFIN